MLAKRTAPPRSAPPASSWRCVCSCHSHFLASMRRRQLTPRWTPSRGIELLLLLLLLLLPPHARGVVYFPRGGSIGYLAAVATPLDLDNRNVYMAFNFEANYGLPSNDTHNQWIERWNLTQPFMGVGSSITPINGRTLHAHRPTRHAFYRSVIGYMQLFQLNATECLLRTICETSASDLDASNGLLGSLLKVLFLPSTSRPEEDEEVEVGMEGVALATRRLHEAEQRGERGECEPYLEGCPCGLLDLISAQL